MQHVAISCSAFHVGRVAAHGTTHMSTRRMLLRPLVHDVSYGASNDVSYGASMPVIIWGLHACHSGPQNGCHSGSPSPGWPQTDSCVWHMVQAAAEREKRMRVVQEEASEALVARLAQVSFTPPYFSCSFFCPLTLIAFSPSLLSVRV